MATMTSEDLLSELAKLIETACEHGDTVSAIAERAAVQRDLISGLRNGTYRATPTLARTEAILNSLGYKIEFKKMS